jgi:parallel beta-helix repeat protein
MRSALALAIAVAVAVFGLALPAAAQAPIPISGTISDGSGGPLLAGQVYHAVGSLSVATGTTLTIQPGAIVKFSLSTGFSVSGTLNCGGAGAAVILTALNDDSAGGDTDGPGPVAGPSYWNGVTFADDSDGSVLTNTELRFGGRFSNPMVVCNSADITLDGCTITTCEADGIDGSNTSTLTVTNCSITNCGGVAIDAVRPWTLSNYSGNTASGNGLNHVRVSAVTYPSSATTISAASQINGAHIIAGTQTIPSTGSLTLEAGVVFKMALSTGINSDGPVFCNGTASNPVVLTSFDDDSFGGDSDNNGTGTAPGPNYWISLDLDTPATDASVLNHLIVRYAGRFATPAIALNDSDCTLTNCTIENCGADGIDLANNSFATVSGCSINNNLGIAIDAVRMAMLPNFSSNTAAGNFGNYIELSGGTLSSDVTVIPDNIVGAALVTVGTQTIATGTTLTLDAGVILKFALSTAFNINGTLVTNGTGGAPVIFTSFDDDSAGGDTNNDAASTTPTASYWSSLSFESDSDASSLTSTEVRYAGRFASPGIRLNNSDSTFIGCTVRDCGADGMDLSSNSNPTVTNCNFTNNLGLALDAVPLTSVPDFLNCSASGNGLGNYTNLAGNAVGQNTIVTPANLVEGVMVAPSSIAVNSGSELVLDAGAVMKMGLSTSLTVNGVLTCQGTPTMPVAITSTQDDDFGGDTNLDGMTLPAKGHWTGISFGNAVDTSSLTRTVVRYAGRFNTPALNCTVGSPFVNSSSIERNLWSAIGLNATVRPQVLNCNLLDNSEPTTGLRIQHLQEFRDNISANNSLRDVIAVNGGALGEVASVYRFNYPNDALHVAGSISVAAGGVLTLGAGVNLKLAVSTSLTNSAGQLYVRGTGYEPVVITASTDDTVGGDTNFDAAATVPTAGHWTTISTTTASIESIFEHLIVRYGGRFGSAQFTNSSANARYRQVRAEFGFASGFNLQNTLGDVWNCIAFQNGSHGFDLGATAGNLVHCNAIDNAGFGLTGNGYPTATALLSNSILRGNVAGSFGFAALPMVQNCNVEGEPSIVGMNGNIDADPLFEDAANGDFHLQAGSPCLETGNVAASNLVVLDFEERSRRVDEDFDGNVLPDIGAFERETFSLEVTGEARLGSVMTYSVVGMQPGSSLIGFGLLDGLDYNPTCGFLTIGAEADVTVFHMGPVNSVSTITMPANPLFEGIEFGVQGGGVTAFDVDRGNFTARWRGRLFN